MRREEEEEEKEEARLAWTQNLGVDILLSMEFATVVAKSSLVSNLHHCPRLDYEPRQWVSRRLQSDKLCRRHFYLKPK